MRPKVDGALWTIVNFKYTYLYNVYQKSTMSYVTISAKVPRRLKELMDKYGIKPGPVIREALEEEIRRRILEEAEEKAGMLSRKIGDLPDEEIAGIIREDRKKR